ncbi:MAG: serine protease [Clostridia bacterium]|nr:serine protease [Clostridia bacterium]
MSDNEREFFGAEENNNPVENNENFYSSKQTSNDNFNQYRDPVEEDIPKVEAEPAYSPYSKQDYSQNTYYSAPQSFDQKPEEKKKNKGFKGFLIAVVAIVVCVAVLLAVYPRFSGNNEDVNKVKGDDTTLNISDSPSLGKNSDSLSTIEIAENAEKINVGILIYGRVQSFISNSTNSLVGEGSGILMGEDKTGKYTYILTCAHVISEAGSDGYTITVQDSEGNTYDGIMVGYDVKTDIGVIKIAKTGLTSAEFGDSSSLRKGQKVYAIGNPGGMEFFGSFTDGMISSIDRPISSESGYEMNCIQHTTPINSGNSGGALLNEFGQVIGINSSKIVSTGYEGMAFAIPISDAKPIIDDIIANGYVTNRPKLGITYTQAMQYQQFAMIIKMKDLPAGSLIIASIASDSSLANTDAEVYDLIVAVNGEKLDTADVLLDKIENGNVGDKLTLTLCRIVDDNYSIEEFEVTATLVEDNGTGTETQEQTTQNYWEQYFNNGF